jgi:hypothetical protein
MQNDPIARLAALVRTTPDDIAFQSALGAMRPQGYTDAVIAADLRRAAKAARDWMRTARLVEAGDSPSKRTRRSSALETLAMVVGRQDAADAATLPRVRRFRRWALGGRLLAPGERRRTTAKGTAHLRRLQRHLAEYYGWTEDEAGRFVLYGTAPPAAFARGRTVLRVGGNGARERIIIEADSRMPASEIVAIYRRLQTPRAGVRRRVRGFTPRESALLAFVQATPSLGWGARLAKWNATHRTQRFADRSNFRRAYRVALAKLDRSPTFVGA